MSTNPSSDGGGYFGMGRLTLGGLGKVIATAVETQIVGSPTATPPPSLLNGTYESNGHGMPPRAPNSQGRQQGHMTSTPSPYKNDSFNGPQSPGGLGVASNLVKMVTAGFASPLDPNSKRDALVSQIAVMRLQAPSYHSGIAMVIDEASLSPVNSPEFRFTWFRQFKHGAKGIRIPDTDQTCAWYPPSADDIGMILCVKVQDAYDLGLSRVLSVKIERPDVALVSRVEEAIDLNRLFIKKTVINVSTFNENGVSNDQINNSSCIHEAPKKGKASRQIESMGSMDETDERAEIDVPASVEVTSSGILLNEKGSGTDSGLLITPSRRLRVACVHPHSLELIVPLHIGSDSATAGNQNQTPLQTQPSVRWLGDEHGDLFEHLSATIQEHHTRFESYLRKQRREQERRVNAVSNGSQSAFEIGKDGVTRIASGSKLNSIGKTTIPEDTPVAVSHADAVPNIDKDMEAEATAEEPFVADEFEDDGTIILDADANFVATPESNEHAIASDGSGRIIASLSADSLEALRREEMEKMIYNEVSLSLSSHGSSMDSEDDYKDQAPKYLSVRVLCQDRLARDTLLFSIRSMVSETPSLPIPVNASSSPSTRLSEEQRKMFLPWRQIECLDTEPSNGAQVPVLKLSKEINNTDINGSNENGGKVSDVSSVELGQLSRLCEDQKSKIRLLSEQLQANQTELQQQRMEVARMKTTYEESELRLREDVSGCHNTIFELQNSIDEKERVMALQASSYKQQIDQLKVSLATEQNRINIVSVEAMEQLEADLELANRSIAELQSELAVYKDGLNAQVIAAPEELACDQGTSEILSMLHADLDQARTEMSYLKTELSSQQQRHQLEVASLEEQLEAVRMERESQTALISCLHLDASKSRDEIDQLSSKLTMLEHKHNEKIDALRVDTEEQVAAERTRMTIEVEAALSDLERARKELVDMTSKMADQEERHGLQMASLRAECTECNRNYEELTERLLSVQSELRLSTDQAAELRTKVQKQEENHRAEIAAMVSSAMIKDADSLGINENSPAADGSMDADKGHKVSAVDMELDQAKRDIEMLTSRLAEQEAKLLASISELNSAPSETVQKPCTAEAKVGKVRSSGLFEIVQSSTDTVEVHQLIVESNSNLCDPKVPISELETQVLGVLVNRWRCNGIKESKSDDTTVESGGVGHSCGDSETTVKINVDCKDLASELYRVLCKHHTVKNSPVAQKTSDLSRLLDSIIFSEEQIGRKPSFDIETPMQTQKKASKPDSQSVSLTSSCEKEEVDSHVHGSGGSAQAQGERLLKHLGHSNSDDNIFNVISDTLIDMLPPPSEESVLESEQKELPIYRSRPVSRSSSRENTPVRHSPRIPGATPPRNGFYGSPVPLFKGLPSPALTVARSPSGLNLPRAKQEVPFRSTDQPKSGAPSGFVFPVTEIIPPEQNVQINIEKPEFIDEHEELLELRIRVCDLEEALARQEEGRHRISEQWPQLEKTFKDMKVAKNKAVEDADRARAELAKLSHEKEEILSELEILRENASNLSELAVAKTEALEEIEEKHNEELQKLYDDNQEFVVQQNYKLRERDEKVKRLESKIVELEDALVQAEASFIDMNVQVGADSKILQSANLTIERLQNEIADLKEALSEAHDQQKTIQTELLKAQKEGNGLKKECARLKDTIATVQRNNEPIAKLKQDLSNLEASLSQVNEELKSSEAKVVSIRKEAESEQRRLNEQLAVALKRADEFEFRIVELENEMLTVSDNRHALTRQKSTAEEMNNQIKKLRARVIEADQEVSAMQALLSEKEEENNMLATDKDALLKEVDTLRNTLEKRKSRIEKLKIEAADCKQLNEQSAKFAEERERLKGIIDSLDKDRTELYALRPQMSKLEAANADIKYQRDLLNNQTKRQADELSTNAMEIRSLESHIQHLESQEIVLKRELEVISMGSEDLRATAVGISMKCNLLQGSNDKLKEDLMLAYTADPIRVKTLNFMLAKLQGEKNHWENKAKSLSRDLHRKLLAGTPLQRELGRVSARLEEMENERNAYKEAMVLACDTFVPQPQSSWFDILS